MKTEQKDLLDNDHGPKQSYTTPQLTVYGTVEEITRNGPTGLLKDAVFQGSQAIL